MIWPTRSDSLNIFPEIQKRNVLWSSAFEWFTHDIFMIEIWYSVANFLNDIIPHIAQNLAWNFVLLNCNSLYYTKMTSISAKSASMFVFSKILTKTWEEAFFVKKFVSLWRFEKQDGRTFYLWTSCRYIFENFVVVSIIKGLQNPNKLWKFHCEITVASFDNNCSKMR